MKSGSQRFSLLVVCGKVDKEVIALIGNDLFNHSRVNCVKDEQWLAHSCQVNSLLISHKDNIEEEVGEHEVVSFAILRKWVVKHGSTEVVTSFVIDPYDCVI